MAPEGHVIFAEPTTEQTGNGRVRIFERNNQSFKFEITVYTGEFRVVFTSHERWMHRAKDGEFKYFKPLCEYIKDVRCLVAKKIENDTTGNFDVIKFLKGLRVANPLASI